MSSLKFSGGGFSRFITGKGFYAALAVCLVGAGAAAWVAVNKTLSSLEYQDDPLAGGTSSFILEEEVPAPAPEAPQPIEDAAAPVSGEPKKPSDSPFSSSKAESALDTQSEPSAKLELPAASPVRPNLVYILPIDGEVFNGFSGGELVKNETLNKWMTHNGVDIKANKGDKVVSISDEGKVLSVENTALWGTVVVIEYPGKLTASYCGLDPEVSVKAGDAVKLKQVVGVIGQVPAEITSSAHLHFEVRKDGKLVDPMEVLGKNAE